MIGVAIQARDTREAVEQIAQAERAGVPAAWATGGAAGGADLLPLFGAAAVSTERILLGTAIVHTWPRHPVVFAQEVLAIEDLAPGRFRLGLGPTGAARVEHVYGLTYDRPLAHLREYLTVLRSVLHEGSVDFEGEHVTARHRIRAPVSTPIMASALRPRSFASCGELADGAISWVCPLAYLVGQALPAIRGGADRANREAPPLVAHVPVAVNTDTGAVYDLARERLAGFATVPFYQDMFSRAGYDVSGGYSDALLDDLIVTGTEEQVAAGLLRWIEAGMGEVLAQPLLDPDDRDGSIARAFGAVARAARELPWGATRQHLVEA